MNLIDFNDLSSADLIVDVVYEGGTSGNTGDDPISKLVPGVGNMGGFRYAGRGDDKSVIVLYTSQAENDWPDLIDYSKGQFIYYGDNRTPGHDIHDTRKGGNRILRTLFDSLHSIEEPRSKIPPIFVFQKYPTENSSRSVQFKGLVVPGYLGVSATDDLIGVWKSTKGQRFQNYRAIFTFLDIPRIPRNFIDGSEAAVGKEYLKSFVDWIDDGVYKPLIAPSTVSIRSKDEQLPKNTLEWDILEKVFSYFEDDPINFEACAGRIFQLQDNNALIEEITRGVRDGGRDAIGKYVLGIVSDPIYAEFSLEAKCYNPGSDGTKANSVGVKETSRLISRIRNRQFGVLVTTSFIASQGYTEVREDGHPIIFITGGDIAKILIDKGYNTKESVMNWLRTEFPNKE